MLILLGAAIIVIEAVRRLINGSEVESVGIGIAIIAVSIVANLVVSGLPLPAGAGARVAGARGRRRPPARRRAHLGRGPRRPRPRRGHRRGVVRLDRGAVGRRARSSRPGSGSRMRSGRVLMDEVLPEEEMDRIEPVIAESRPPEMAGYHKLRGRRAGSRRHIDLHVQFRSGTSLEEAHREAHQLRDAIEARVQQRRRADPRRARGVLPPAGEAARPLPPGLRAQVRLTAAASPTAIEGDRVAGVAVDGDEQRRDQADRRRS